MADFADLKPIITNTKKKGSSRTTRSSASSKFSNEVKEIPEIPDTLQVKGQDAKEAEIFKPNVFTIDGEKFTIRHWNVFFGYLFVRVFVPILLIVHCFIVMFSLWKAYKSVSYTMIQSAQIFVPLFTDFLLTKFLTKLLFRKSIYLIHPDYPLTQQL